MSIDRLWSTEPVPYVPTFLGWIEASTTPGPPDRPDQEGPPELDPPEPEDQEDDDDGGNPHGTRSARLVSV